MSERNVVRPLWDHKEFISRHCTIAIIGWYSPAHGASGKESLRVPGIKLSRDDRADDLYAPVIIII